MNQKFQQFFKTLGIKPSTLFDVYFYLNRQRSLKWIKYKLEDKIITEEEYLKELLIAKNSANFVIWKDNGEIYNRKNK